MIIERWWNYTDKGKPKFSEKNLELYSKFDLYCAVITLDWNTETGHVMS